MSKLKIRTKIILWYSAFSIVLLGVLLPVVYGTISNSLYQSLRSELHVAISRMVSSLEVDDNELAVDFDLDIENGILVCMTDENKNIVFASRNGKWLSDVPDTDGDNAMVTHNGAEWMVIGQEYHADGLDLKLFVGSSTASVAHSLGNLRILLLALVPLYLGLSALGAYFIARRTLSPIAEITETARSIGEGDLSHRIEGIVSEDEVGELAAAFNAMLDKVEASFCRERQFSSDASHELRMPVAIISACTEDALNGDQSPETTENLMTIQREGTRMNHIISQLLMLTRGYEGRYYVEKEWITLRDMLDSIIDELSDMATEANIRLENDVAGDTRIYADQSLITQLFVNIIGNGIKYGKAGGMVIISAEGCKERTEILVSDDGIGMSAEDIPHIFERFYRADKARNRTGTGLGLSIVKWIVEIHGGDITASSEEGEGTMFRISLPNQPQKKQDKP